MLCAKTLTDLAATERIADSWDELAVACSRPTAAPAWMLAWWQTLAPRDAALRTIAVYDGDSLVGVAPFFAERRRSGCVHYRLLGNALPRATPLAAPGREWDVAGVVASALSACSPRADLVALEAGPLASPWHIALRQQWPSKIRPALRTYMLQPSPTIDLRAASFDAWLESRSPNFRGQMRAIRRRFARSDGIARLSTIDTLDRDLDALLHLHRVRWQGRGTSSIVADERSNRAMYSALARAHLHSGRFRLWMLELDGAPISAQMFVEAGGEILYINGGWDERFAKLKPAMLGILYAVEQGIGQGESRMDLAPGAQPYKLRFADGGDPVAWTILVIPSVRMPLTALSIAPMLGRISMREAARRALSPQAVERGRRLRRRARGARQR